MPASTTTLTLCYYARADRLRHRRRLLQGCRDLADRGLRLPLGQTHTTEAEVVPTARSLTVAPDERQLTNPRIADPHEMTALPPYRHGREFA